MSMEKASKFQRFLDLLTDVSGKVAQTKVMTSLTEAYGSVLAIIVVGSFALLVAALDLGPWQKIVTSIPYLVDVCYTIKNVTVGLLSLYLVFLLSYQYSGKIELRQRLVVSAVSAGTFLMITPFTSTGDLSMEWLGTQGLICSMLIGILVPLAIKKMIDAKLNIKLPDSVPTPVADSFAVLIPSAIIFIIAGVLNSLASLTSYGNIQNLLFMLIQTPMTKVGLSAPGFTILFTLSNVAWWCGIHGNAVFSPMLALLMAASAANQEAILAGTPLPNTIEYSFCQMLFPGGYGMALIITIVCCFMKSDSVKSIGKTSAVPALFNIGEPILFGLPCLFNGLILIPVLISSVFNCVYWIGLSGLGIVGKFTGIVLPWTTPAPIYAFLGSTTPVIALIVELIMIAIDCAIFYPFIKKIDQNQLSEGFSGGNNVE